MKELTRAGLLGKSGQSSYRLNRNRGVAGITVFFAKGDLTC